MRKRTKFLLAIPSTTLYSSYILYFFRMYHPALIIIIGLVVSYLMLEGSNKKIFFKLICALILATSLGINFWGSKYFIISNFVSFAWSYLVIDLLSVIVLKSKLKKKQLTTKG